MIKLIVFLFGLSIFWITVTCFPAQPEIQENQLPLNRTLREIPCKDNEYPSQAICCQFCPAGTFVAEYCTKDHQRGSCQPCTSGEDYTAAASALEQCLSCRVCREDEVKVQACTPKTNTVCKCKPGTFCIPGEVCEICMRCSRCGKGQRIKEECTATRNTVCEDIPITQPTSNTTRSHVKQVPNSTKNISPTPEKDITKDVNRTTDKDITKDVNRTTDKDDVTQDPNSMNKTDPYIVLCIILALVIITILALFGCNVFKKNKKDKTNEPKLLDIQTQDSSVTSSVTSTPEAGRANQVEREQLQEAEPLLTAINVAAPLNTVTVPTENSSTEGAQNSAEPGPGGDDHGGGGGGTPPDEPCTICNQFPPCECYWTPFFHCVIDHVRSEYIVRLVRDLRVPNNIIDNIIRDNPGSSYEQSYKLLERWRTLSGKKASMEKVFSALRNMEMGGCVENMINYLKSKRISIN